MKERMLQLITRMGYTSTRFADEIGVQRSGISHILSGRNQPSYDLIVKILTRFPDVNTDWFVLGKGPMLKTGEQEIRAETEPKGHIPKLSKEPNLFTGSLSTAAKPDPLKQEKKEVTYVTSIDRILVLNSDGTFDVYHQAKRE